MKIHFEPNLAHQSEAIAATIGAFEGAPYAQPEERLWTGEVSSNVLKLGVNNWQENVAFIAAENNIDDYAPSDARELSIEMETGTGKTYVYLRTMFELHRRYGLHKFIVVVPSVAIREGALTALRLTREHFRGIYATEASVVEYDSGKMAEVRAFCVSNHLSIMVMNKQAFDSDAKVINDESRDGGNLLAMLRQVQPIIVMDEPQEGMDTPNMRARLAAFDPLLKLRYSATHREPRNIVYRLAPFDAYNRGLVKKIAVLSIHETNTQSNVAIEFRTLTLGLGNPTAKLQLNVCMANREIKPKLISARRGDDLERKTRNPAYRGWVIEDIGTTDLYDGVGYVKFTNGERIDQGERHGSDKEAVFREQIRRTVQTHLRRQAQLVPLGIKPLSLIFIDRVANYVEQDGLIRRLFEEEYVAAYRKDHKIDPANVRNVHGGYFAKTGTGDYTDNPKSMATNAEVYDKILRAKETLLSFDEPLEFIFTHSALGVGWDNPNVFTICTLNESQSAIKKRQEIGRGLRLCVDQHGKRYRDPEDVLEGKEVNLLTVVANQSYHDFVSSYQQELAEEVGADTKPPPLRDANRKPVELRLNQQHFTSEDFKALWDIIGRKTRYRVHFREEELVRKSVSAMSGIVIDENRLEVSLTYWSGITKDGKVEHQTEGSTRAALRARLAPVDLVSELARNTALSYATAAVILDGLPAKQKKLLAKNPVQFLAVAAKKVRQVLESEMVRLVKYEQTGDHHPLNLFEAVVETRRDTTATSKRGLYDRIIHDSDVEGRFAEDLDGHPAVRVFVKLPAGYTIPTPIGSYNPDFALVIARNDLDQPEANGRFYFTVETKGTAEWNKLRPDEKSKIQCALKHFEAVGLRAYLAPVEDLMSFDDRARERIDQTFFNS